MHCPGTEESSSLESFALDLGDCIGVESCLDLKTDLEEEIISASQSKIRRDKGLGMMKRGKIEKEYPPPIPWLARTENLPSHMPWIMKKYYTSDGRLIIREEKVKGLEYFQAHRSDGRLTLRLVPLADDVSDDDNDDDVHDYDDEEENDNVHADKDGEVDGFVNVAAEVITENQTEKEEESIPNLSESCMEKCGGSGGGECYKSVRRSSCMFGMTLPAFRPVHT